MSRTLCYGAQMVRKWGDFQYRKGLDPWHWATTSPLFAIAGLMFIALAAFIVWFVLANLSSPRKFVIVETYELDLGTLIAHEPGFRVELKRVTYQPGFDIRLSSTLREQDGPSVFMDGLIVNNEAGSRTAFVLWDWPSPPPGGRIGPGRAVRATEHPVRSLKGGSCPSLDQSAAIIKAGETLRFNLWIRVGEGSGNEWVAEAVRRGLLPALRLGGVANGDCPPLDRLTAAAPWEIRFEEQKLPGVELRDYYPFGAPTALEVGLNGRKYWSDWLPRTR